MASLNTIQYNSLSDITVGQNLVIHHAPPPPEKKKCFDLHKGPGSSESSSESSAEDEEFGGFLQPTFSSVSKDQLVVFQVHLLQTPRTQPLDYHQRIRIHHLQTKQIVLVASLQVRKGEKECVQVN